jgi:hypothetical protein
MFLGCEKPCQTRYKETPPPQIWEIQRCGVSTTLYFKGIVRPYDEGNEIVTKMFRQCGESGSAWISLQGPDFSGMGNVQGLAPGIGRLFRHKRKYKSCRSRNRKTFPAWGNAVLRIVTFWYMDPDPRIHTSAYGSGSW